MSELAPAGPEPAPPGGSAAAGIRVNESLSRGLATRAFEMLAKQGDKYRANVRSVLRPRVRSKKAIGRVTQELKLLGERAKLIQVIGSKPNQRQVTVCQFVPQVITDDDGKRRALQFMLHQFVITQRGMHVGDDFGVALTATDHAVERLFLRLNTMELGAVFDDLHDAMLLAMPLWAIGMSLRLRQVALPTSSGTFLCSLDPDRSYLLAKTWIDHRSLGGRWAPVVNGIRRAVAKAGGTDSLATTLSLGIAQSFDDSDNRVLAELGEALSSHPWLREAYAPRADPVGDAWKSHAAD